MLAQAILAQPLKVDDLNSAVLDTYEARLRKDLQRSICTLTRQSHESRQYFLRNGDGVSIARIKNRVEQYGELGGHPRLWRQRTVMLNHSDELPESLIELDE